MMLLGVEINFIVYMPVLDYFILKNSKELGTVLLHYCFAVVMN